MKLCGIYCITNTLNNKRYIGQSVDIKQRLWIHKNRLKYNAHFNPYLQQSYNKHGKENFEYSVICICPPEELDEKEIYYISLYNTQKSGYNRASGGKVNYTIRNDGQKKKASKNQSEFAINIVRILHEKRLNEKGTCLECGAETKNGYRRYCEHHNTRCLKCGARFSKNAHKVKCSKCENWDVPKCVDCGNEISKNSNRQKRCKPCEKIENRNKKRRWDRLHRSKAVRKFNFV